MNIGPERRDSIQILLAMDVVEIDPFASFNHQLRGFHPLLHLGERMPEILLVQGFVVFGVGFHVSNWKSGPASARNSDSRDNGSNQVARLRNPCTLLEISSLLELQSSAMAR